MNVQKQNPEEVIVSKDSAKYIQEIRQPIADIKHKNVPTQAKRKYLSRKLELDKNPLLENDEDKEKLIQILMKHWNVFDYYNERIPTAESGIKYNINMKTEIPIKSKCRPLNPIISQKREKLQDLEKRGIIRKSNSPYASPILVVAKGNGDFRLVADYRKLNENIIGNDWTIPNIEMSLANLSRQKFFSQLDLKEAFFGVELTENSIPKSAIITPWGLFEYLRSNFGIKDSMNV